MITDARTVGSRERKHLFALEKCGYEAAMISVVIPTLNAGARFEACLSALAPAAIDGVVKELIVVDGGSTDGTLARADAAGARILNSDRGRGRQLRAGAAAARAEWLLFLHADTVLEPSWVAEALARCMPQSEAGVFTLDFDTDKMPARLVAAGAMLRTRLFRLPYGDQGLLIPRDTYDAVGGYASMDLFEDVDFMERLVASNGARSFCVLRAKATTSSDRYERNGYARQVLANFMRILRYKLGADVNGLARDYHA